ncbi:Replication_factor C [Hexamita inflata]|uniref:Replication factor C n=1 Tax=Hexamita inflata TaxID=28002 RepID=A0AA86TWE3_9EUKA|nr:Replication factor C [Hexamita inflata]
MQKPFVELYRPQTLSEVVGNQQTVERLKYFVDNGNLPNILFSSPPGMGKTTIAHCLGRQMLADQFKQAFIELNASDERNISDIRERVRTFAQLQVTLPVGRHKIVFLDECDAMTSQAQLALRRIMEDCGDSTRFILACNIVSKVVEPLQSRCCVITLQPPSVEDIITRLRQICEKASIKAGPEALRLLADLADGDVRNAVNNLQTASLALQKQLTEAGIRDVLDFIDVNQVGKIYSAAKTRFDEGHSQLQKLFIEGYSADEIVAAFYRFGMNPKTVMTDQTRAKFLKAVAQCHARLAGGINSELQVARMLVEATE